MYKIKERIKKAESLSPDIREQFLFTYLKLKTLVSKEKNKEYFLWDTFCNLICFAEENNIISSSNLSKLIEEFENDYKTTKSFDLDLLIQFFIYILINK